MEPDQIGASKENKSWQQIRLEKEKFSQNSLMMYVLGQNGDDDEEPDLRGLKSRCRDICRMFVRYHKNKDVVKDYSNIRVIKVEELPTVSLGIFLQSLETTREKPWAALAAHALQWARHHEEVLKEGMYNEYAAVLKEIELIESIAAVEAKTYEDIYEKQVVVEGPNKSKLSNVVRISEHVEYSSENDSEDESSDDSEDESSESSDSSQKEPKRRVKTKKQTLTPSKKKHSSSKKSTLKSKMTPARMKLNHMFPQQLTKKNPMLLEPISPTPSPRTPTNHTPSSFRPNSPIVPEAPSSSELPPKESLLQPPVPRIAVPKETKPAPFYASSSPREQFPKPDLQKTQNVDAATPRQPPKEAKALPPIEPKHKPAPAPITKAHTRPHEVVHKPSPVPKTHTRPQEVMPKPSKDIPIPVPMPVPSSTPRPLDGRKVWGAGIYKDAREAEVSGNGDGDGENGELIHSQPWRHAGGVPPPDFSMFKAMPQSSGEGIACSDGYGGVQHPYPWKDPGHSEDAWARFRNESGSTSEMGNGLGGLHSFRGGESSPFSTCRLGDESPGRLPPMVHSPRPNDRSPQKEGSRNQVVTPELSRLRRISSTNSINLLQTYRSCSPSPLSCSWRSGSFPIRNEVVFTVSHPAIRISDLIHRLIPQVVNDLAYFLSAPIVAENSIPLQSVSLTSRNIQALEVVAFSSDRLREMLYGGLFGNMIRWPHCALKDGLAENPNAFLEALRECQEKIGLWQDPELASEVVDGDEEKLQEVLRMIYQQFQQQSARFLRFAMESLAQLKVHGPQKPYFPGLDPSIWNNLPTSMSVVDMSFGKPHKLTRIQRHRGSEPDIHHQARSIMTSTRAESSRNVHINADQKYYGPFSPFKSFVAKAKTQRRARSSARR